MKKTAWTMIGTAALTATLVTSTAYAGPITQREQRQHGRIRQGVQSGRLTRGETRHLVGEQAHIERLRRRDLADGHIGPREAAGLAHAQDKANRDIYELKHNERQRPVAE